MTKQLEPKLGQAALLILALFVLSACDVTAPQTPAAEGVGLALRIDPQTEEVALQRAAPADQLSTQAEGNTRLLVQGVDFAPRDFNAEFFKPDTLVITLRLENITEDLAFTQPFAFSPNPASDPLQASLPTVMDEQLGGDGVLSPGETSEPFRFEVTFNPTEPFTFAVDTRAGVARSAGATCTNPVSIPDVNLEEQLRDVLDKPEGDLTCEDLASLEALNAESFFVDFEIRNLEGLQFAVNLMELNLEDNLVSDLSPLASLTKLVELDLDSNVISDPSPLAHLTNLIELRLEENTISDLSPLKNLVSLEELFLAENTISDLTGLENLTSLTALELNGNAVSDLAPLGGLTNLDSLDLFENAISDLSPLSDLTNLRLLDLDDNDVSDLAPLAGLANLESLRLLRNAVDDLSGLSNLPSLEALTISENTVSDLTPLESVPSLQVLDVEANAVSDLSGLEGLSALRTLRASNNTVSDLTPLAGLPSLGILELNANAVSDIGPLIGISSLLFVDLGENPLSVQALGDIETLRERDVTVSLE